MFNNVIYLFKCRILFSFFSSVLLVSLQEELLAFSDSDEDDTDEIIAELSEKRKQLRQQGASVKLTEDNNERSMDAEFSESELSDNALEEKEARLIQRRHAEQISEHDFDYEFAQLLKAAEVPHDKTENIQEDLSDLSNKQKWQIIRNTSPDLIPVIERCKSLLSVCDNALSGSGVSSASVKSNLSIDFCMNIGIYLILKISHEPDVHNHPVTRRLLDYQLLMQQLESTESESKRYMKTKVKQPKQHAVAPTLLSEGLVDSSDEEERSITESAEDITDVGRRTITDQILRNRGLTPHRKKEYKNPRVKHRLKYRKAVIRRRGQIRPVRNELTAYAGETSGIRAAVKRGIRLKA